MYTVWHVDKLKLVINHWTNEISYYFVVSSDQNH
jgi:hypothetical protein